jgi:hypothetical protein
MISMSLGGRAFFGLERAIRDAVRRDVIVLAAAGNCVGFVVAPAVYDQSIAVAATNAQKKPWKGSSHGRAVELSAPGEDIHVAAAESGTGTHAKTPVSNGTSFAVAAVAGAGADWIAFHGAQAIREAQGPRTRRDLFVEALQATAERPDDWNASQYGAGILDVEALLRHPLTAAGAAAAVPARNDPVSILSRMFDRDPAKVRAAFVQLFPGAPDLDDRVERFGPEIVFMASRDPDQFLALLDAPTAETAAAGAVRQQAAQAFSSQGSQALLVAGAQR